MTVFIICCPWVAALKSSLSLLISPSTSLVQFVAALDIVLVHLNYILRRHFPELWEFRSVPISQNDTYLQRGQVRVVLSERDIAKCVPRTALGVEWNVFLANLPMLSLGHDVRWRGKCGVGRRARFGLGF